MGARGRTLALDSGLVRGPGPTGRSRALPVPAGPATRAARADAVGAPGELHEGAQDRKRLPTLSNPDPGRYARHVADRILLEGLVLPVALGVSQAERDMRRPVDIDLEIETDLGRAGTSDRLEHTLDYGEVYRAVEEVAADGEYRLVESLAEQIARAVLARYPVESCTVTVRKRSPLAGDLRHAGVRITRSKQSAPA